MKESVIEMLKRYGWTFSVEFCGGHNGKEEYQTFKSPRMTKFKWLIGSTIEEILYKEAEYFFDQCPRLQSEYNQKCKEIKKQIIDKNRLILKENVEIGKDNEDLFNEIIFSGLLHLKKGWNGYNADPPNWDVINKAKTFLQLIPKNKAFELVRKILPSAEGGIGIIFKRNGKYSNVEFFNNGEIFMSFGQNEKNIIGPMEWTENHQKNCMEMIINFLNC